MPWCCSKKREKIASAATGQSYEIMDAGMLLTGQVGYVVTGMRSTKEARVGDTLHHVRSVIQPLPGKLGYCFTCTSSIIAAGIWFPTHGI